MDESQFDDLNIDEVAPDGASDEEVTGPLPDGNPLDGDREIENLEIVGDVVNNDADRAAVSQPDEGAKNE